MMHFIRAPYVPDPGDSDSDTGCLATGLLMVIMIMIGVVAFVLLTMK